VSFEHLLSLAYLEVWICPLKSSSNMRLITVRCCSLTGFWLILFQSCALKSTLPSVFSAFDIARPRQSRNRFDLLEIRLHASQTVALWSVVWSNLVWHPASSQQRHQLCDLREQARRQQYPDDVQSMKAFPFESRGGDNVIGERLEARFLFQFKAKTFHTAKQATLAMA